MRSLVTVICHREQNSGKDISDFQDKYCELSDAFIAKPSYTLSFECSSQEILIKRVKRKSSSSERLWIWIKMRWERNSFLRAPFRRYARQQWEMRQNYVRKFCKHQNVEIQSNCSTWVVLCHRFLLMFSLSWHWICVLTLEIQKKSLSSNSQNRERLKMNNSIWKFILRKWRSRATHSFEHT